MGAIDRGNVHQDTSMDFSKTQKDKATKPGTREERVKNMEVVVGDLEVRFHKIFGHKIKTLGLVDDISPEKRREIIKVCVANFSHFDKEKGGAKEGILPQKGKEGLDPSPEKDPILSQVPKTEWLLCERFLGDLNVAYIALDNLIKEDMMG